MRKTILLLVVCMLSSVNIVADSLGDVNHDKIIDENDIKEIRNYILGTPSRHFDFDEADVNRDGVVNVADIVAIIGTGLESLCLVDGDGQEYFPFLWAHDTIHIYVPHDKDLTHLQLVYQTDGHEDDIPIASGTTMDFSDFTKPVKLDVAMKIGSAKTYTIQVYDLPVLSFDTPDGLPITSKTERTEGCRMQLVDIDGTIKDLGEAGIRGRGNSTFLLPKKPYNIKLSKKRDILGMKSSKHWVLLANAYYDRTQLHNATAFEMARLTDFPWVQSGTFVELFVNGTHQGLYYLCEKIRIEKGKIDITEIKPEDLSGEELTGGYLLESAVGEYPEGCIFSDYFNKTGYDFAYKLGWELKHPEDDVPAVQREFITNSLNQMEALLANEEQLLEGTYRDYFDIETAINWWMVEEASLNEEASRTKNVYLYKDRNDKFRIGPPWDFDAWSFGFYGTSHFFCTKTALYFGQLFKDPVFINRLKEKWAVTKNVWLEQIPAFIDGQYDLIRRSAERNEMMWPDYCEEFNTTEKTYHQSVIEMKEAFLTQLEWMDQKISENYFDDFWDEIESQNSNN